MKSLEQIKIELARNPNSISCRNDLRDLHRFFKNRNIDMAMSRGTDGTPEHVEVERQQKSVEEVMIGLGMKLPPGMSVAIEDYD